MLLIENEFFNVFDEEMNLKLQVKLTLFMLALFSHYVLLNNDFVKLDIPKAFADWYANPSSEIFNYSSK